MTWRTIWTEESLMVKKLRSAREYQALWNALLTGGVDATTIDYLVGGPRCPDAVRKDSTEEVDGQPDIKTFDQSTINAVHANSAIAASLVRDDSRSTTIRNLPSLGHIDQQRDVRTTERSGLPFDASDHDSPIDDAKSSVHADGKILLYHAYASVYIETVKVSSPAIHGSGHICRIHVRGCHL